MAKKKKKVIVTPDNPNTPENEEVSEEVESDEDEEDEATVGEPLLDVGTEVWFYDHGADGLFTQTLARVSAAHSSETLSITVGETEVRSVPKWVPGAKRGWWVVP